MGYQRSKKNICIIPTGNIDPRQAAYQDIMTWDDELAEQLEEEIEEELGIEDEMRAAGAH